MKFPRKEVNAEFGRFIKKIRTERGITQMEMCEQIGIQQPYYSCLESGQRVIDFYVALRICDVLNVSVDDFVSQYKNPVD